MTVVPSTEIPFRSKVGAQLVLGFALIAIWEATATWLVDPFWIGKPSAIALRLWDVFVHGDMLTHTGVTLFHSVVGLLLSLVIGVPIGILFAASAPSPTPSNPIFSASTACRGWRSRRCSYSGSASARFPRS